MKKPDKLIRLVHNPTAGSSEYSKKNIINLLEFHGYRCSYDTSKKKILKAIVPETDFIVIAGGDGTIKRTIMCLLNKKLKYKRPIALLPFGTANNIATSLNIPANNSKNIRSWADSNLKKFDVGQVTGLKNVVYFIESFGFGIFSRLMKVLNKMNTNHIKTSKQEFKLALETLLELSKEYKAVPFKIEIDNQVIQDKAIMIEVMNISYLGPNLQLSEGADSGDGYFDVIIVTEKNRKKIATYLKKKMESKQPTFPIQPIRAKNLKIHWEGKDLHGDDELIKVNYPIHLKISLLDSLLEIITPSTRYH